MMDQFDPLSDYIQNAQAVIPANLYQVSHDCLPKRMLVDKQNNRLCKT